MKLKCITVKMGAKWAFSKRTELGAVPLGSFSLLFSVSGHGIHPPWAFSVCSSAALFIADG